MRILTKVIQLPQEEKMLLLEAVFFLFFSKMYLWMPFKYCIKQLGYGNSSPKQGDPVLLIKVKIAVARANRLVFWSNVCLVKSFAARFMLQRRQIDSVVYLGLQFKDNEELYAHAWLIANEVYVTPKGRTRYKEIFSF